MLFLKDVQTDAVVPQQDDHENSTFTKVAIAAMPYALVTLIVLRCLSITKFCRSNVSEADTSNAESEQNAEGVVDQEDADFRRQ